MKRWFLDQSPDNGVSGGPFPEGEAEDHLFTASIVAAIVLGLVVIATVVATLVLAARLVGAWLA